MSTIVIVISLPRDVAITRHLTHQDESIRKAVFDTSIESSVPFFWVDDASAADLGLKPSSFCAMTSFDPAPACHVGDFTAPMMLSFVQRYSVAPYYVADDENITSVFTSTLTKVVLKSSDATATENFLTLAHDERFRGKVAFMLAVEETSVEFLKFLGVGVKEDALVVFDNSFRYKAAPHKTEAEMGKYIVDAFNGVAPRFYRSSGDKVVADRGISFLTGTTFNDFVNNAKGHVVVAVMRSDDKVSNSTQTMTTQVTEHVVAEMVPLSDAAKDGISFAGVDPAVDDLPLEIPAIPCLLLFKYPNMKRAIDGSAVLKAQTPIAALKHVHDLVGWKEPQIPGAEDFDNSMRQLRALADKQPSDLSAIATRLKSIIADFKKEDKAEKSSKKHDEL